MKSSDLRKWSRKGAPNLSPRTRAAEKSLGWSEAEPQEFGHQKHSSPRTRATAIEEELWLSLSQT